MEQKTSGVLKDFFISLLSVLAIVYILFNIYTFYSVWRCSTNLVQPPQQEYIRLIIYGTSSTRDGNTISAAFSIVDTNGNEIARIERSWTGNYLAVEFAQSDFDGKSFLFPTNIYGKDRIMQSKPNGKKKTSLEKFYDDNKQCLLLGFGSSYEERNDLYKIARFTTRKVPVLSFGHISNYSIDLSECKINRYYSIQRTSDGRLIVVEL
ncbi:MAG: hypothetical protein J5726_01500 [Treponema sp.]|nr:hypothetical protein [Treponema sp.]